MDRATIRPATAADARGVAETVKEVYEEYGFTWDPEVYHRDLIDFEATYLGQDNIWFWVAVDAAEGVVGCIGLERFELRAGEPGNLDHSGPGLPRICGCDAEIHRLYVRPSARKMGIGQGLSDALIETSRTVGVVALEIWTDKRFESAHRLYERFGAIKVGDRICDDPDVSPEWGMMLRV